MDERKPDREFFYQTLIGIIAGLGSIAIALAPPNDITYLPGDPRGRPEYHEQVSTILIVLGVVTLSVVFVRLLLWLRNRP